MRVAQKRQNYTGRRPQTAWGVGNQCRRYRELYKSTRSCKDLWPIYLLTRNCTRSCKGPLEFYKLFPQGPAQDYARTSDAISLGSPQDPLKDLYKITQGPLRRFHQELLFKDLYKTLAKMISMPGSLRKNRTRSSDKNLTRASQQSFQTSTSETGHFICIC
jgi:hypothetical protein